MSEGVDERRRLSCNFCIENYMSLSGRGRTRARKAAVTGTLTRFDKG